MTGPRRRLTAAEAHQLTLDTQPWLSCEDCFDLMDPFAEAVVADPETTRMPAMVVHVRACPACAEEVEALLVLVAGDLGVDPSLALRRVR